MKPYQNLEEIECDAPPENAHKWGCLYPGDCCVLGWHSPEDCETLNDAQEVWEHKIRGRRIENA